MSTQSVAPAPALKRGHGLPVELVVNNILLLALLVLVVYFTTHSGAFLTISNIKVLLTKYASIGVVASTLALLVIAGQVDLSVGSNIAFSRMITALAMTAWQMSPIMGAVLGLLFGAMISLVSGVLCAFLRFGPIIVTLGMLSVLRGADQNTPLDCSALVGSSIGRVQRRSSRMIRLSGALNAVYS